MEEIKASIIDATSAPGSASSVQPASACVAPLPVASLVAPAVIEPIVEEDVSAFAEAADSVLNSAVVCDEEPSPSSLVRDHNHNSVAAASAKGAVTTRRRMAMAPPTTRHAMRPESEWEVVAQEDQHAWNANHNSNGATASAATVVKRDPLSPRLGEVGARAPFGEISNVMQSK